MTLKQLAHKIHTTPQTIQRLETDNMTVSMDWLQKIARALTVEPVDLVGVRDGREIPLLGRADEHGRIVPREQEAGTSVHLDVAADDPVAVRIDAPIGGFEPGTVLIGNRFRPEDLDNAHGMNCLVAVADGPVLLRRLVRGRSSGWTLIPHENGGEVQYDRAIAWAARILMAIRYY
jgi:transcriptional regulator with XRE-family HTH domain